MKTIVKKIMVRKSIFEVFEVWANFQNFPLFMDYIKKIDTLDSGESQWTIRGPSGITVVWNAKTTSVETNKKISWVADGGQIQLHGSVLFRALEADRTQVTVGLEYELSSGFIGEALAGLFDHPDRMLEADLRRFKKVMEGSRHLPDTPISSREISKSSPSFVINAHS